MAIRKTIALSCVLIMCAVHGNQATLHYGFFVVHCEPLISNDPLKIDGAMNLRRPAKYWSALSELVDLAQTNGHRLTIMFNPQWAVYAAQSPLRRLQVLDWTLAGHEFALHHHGKEALDYGNEWDGFSNNEILAHSSNYFGNVPFMMSQGIYTNYTILTATTENGDWPDGIRYYATGGKEPYINASHLGDLVSTAAPTSMAGLVNGSMQHNGVWAYRMRHFTTAAVQTQVLSESRAAVIECSGFASNTYVVGYVTHAKNFYDEAAKGHYQQLFSFLTSAQINLTTVSNIATMMDLGTPKPSPSISIALNATNTLLTWDTTNDGLSYTLQQASQLHDPHWTTCSELIFGDGSNHYQTISTTNTAQFYRIQVD